MFSRPCDDIAGIIERDPVARNGRETLTWHPGLHAADLASQPACG